MNKIWAFLIAVWKILVWFNSKAKQKLNSRKQGFNTVKEGIKNEDTSSITSGFDDINNV